MSAVSEIMSDGIVTADGDAGLSALDIAGKLAENRAGAVIVLEKGSPAGIRIERDILKMVSAQNKRPQGVQARRITSSPMITVRAYNSVDTVAAAMTQNRIKRLRVVET